MNHTSGSLSLSGEARRAPGIALGSIVLPFFGALVLTGVILWLGPIPALAIVLFLAVVLPFFVRDLFRPFLFLIVTWPVLTLYVRVPHMPYERGIALMITGMLLAAAFVRRLKLPGIGILAGIYLVAQLVLLGSNFLLHRLPDSHMAGNLYLEGIALPVLIYWLTKSLVTSTWHVKWLLSAVIAASVIVCLTGIYERAVDTKDSPFPVSAHNEAGDTRYLGVPGGRASGVMGNPAIYGAVLGMGALASLAGFAHAQRKRTKALLAFTAGLLLYGVFVSFTRSAWLSALVAIFVAQFFIKGLWKKTLPVLAISTFLLIWIWQSLPQSDPVKERLLEQRNVVGRFERTIFALKEFEQKPLFGWGSGSLDILTAKRYPTEGFSTSHNTFVTMLVDDGLLVSLLFLALIISWLLHAAQAIHRSGRNSFERSAAAVFLGFMLIYLVSGMALELRYFDYINALLWISAAAIERLRTQSADREESPSAISS